MLHPAEQKLLQLARQLGAVGQQAAITYHQAQASLPLDQLLTPDRLMSAKATDDGFEILASMTQLTDAHRKMFAQFMSAAMGQFAAAVAELPADRARAYEEGLITRLNAQLASQAEFYRNRARWVDAVHGIFTLFTLSRARIRYIDGELLFDDDASYDRFQLLIGTVEEIHHAEVTMMTERVSRAAAANAVLDAWERGAGAV